MLEIFTKAPDSSLSALTPRAFARTDDTVVWKASDAISQNPPKFHPGTRVESIQGARRDIRNSPRQSRDAHFHAGRDPGNGEGTNRRQPKNCRHARAFGQHLSLAPSSRPQGF